MGSLVDRSSLIREIVIETCQDICEDLDFGLIIDKNCHMVNMVSENLENTLSVYLDQGVIDIINDYKYIKKIIRKDLEIIIRISIYNADKILKTPYSFNKMPA